MLSIGTLKEMLLAFQDDGPVMGVCTNLMQY